MNKRIRELAAIARGQAIVGTTVDEEQWRQHEEFVEKFAELIVKECAELSADNPGYNGLNIFDKILKHFGVEE